MALADEPKRNFWMRANYIPACAYSSNHNAHTVFSGGTVYEVNCLAEGVVHVSCLVHIHFDHPWGQTRIRS